MKRIVFFPGIPQLRENLEKRFLQKLQDEFDVSFFNGDIKNVEVVEYYIMYSAGAMWLPKLIRRQKLHRAKKIIFIAPAGLSLNRNVAVHVWRYFGEIWKLAKVEPLLAFRAVKESLKISFATTKLIVNFDLRDSERKIFGRLTDAYLLRFSSDRLTSELDLPGARKITLSGGHFGILTNPDTINQIKKVLNDEFDS